MHRLLECFALCFILQPIFTLRIATSLAWIEHTPQPYAIKNFYNGSAATLTSGGASELASKPQDFELAANAETQGLNQYAQHRNVRMIYVICEVAYRIIADKRKGIRQLSDLKGKTIATFAGSSASVFVHNMMSSVGVEDSQYSTPSGSFCMKAPCASNTLPSELKAGTIDAFGTWEPAVELAAQALGSNAIIFQNASVYREVYALYSTTDALNNPSKRRDIVAYVRALNKTLDIFANRPKENGIYNYVAKEVGMDATVAETVWSDHKWGGTLDNGLIDFLVAEDKYLAGKDKRSVTLRKDLEKFLDRSVIAEL